MVAGRVLPPSPPAWAEGCSQVHVGLPDSSAVSLLHRSANLLQTHWRSLRPFPSSKTTSCPPMSVSGTKRCSTSTKTWSAKMVRATWLATAAAAAMMMRRRPNRRAPSPAAVAAAAAAAMMMWRVAATTGEGRQLPRQRAARAQQQQQQQGGGSRVRSRTMAANRMVTGTKGCLGRRCWPRCR